MKTADIRAIVTGASSGLGAATARELVLRGATVAALGREADRGRAVVEPLGASARFWSADIVDADSLASTFAEARDWFGSSPNVLVNCAGIGVVERTVSRSPRASSAGFRSVIDTNVLGTYQAVQAFVGPLTREIDRDGRLGDGDEHGVVVLTSSIAAWDGQPGQVAYAAAKGAVAAMTLPLAREGAPFGIRFVTIAPGIFATPMLDPLPAGSREALAAASVWPPRLGEPEEFASFVGAVLDNPALNGAVVRLDGAMRLPAR